MNRLIACVSAAVLAASASVLGPAPAAQAATQRVSPEDLGPGRAWIRLQDDPSATRPHGIEEVSPFAAPNRFDGSLHLAIGPGQQSQAAHYFTAPVALSRILGSGISYDSYVDGAHTSVTDTGANLQLPMFCHGAFTTLSFQPQRATDGQGRDGVVPNVWQHWDSGADGIWRTSRAIADIPAGGDAPLGDFADACEGDESGVIGLIGNVGSLGDPSGTLDAYVDNLTVNGTTYDFAVDGTTTAHLSLHHDLGDLSGRRVRGVAAFHSPLNGPLYRGVGARIVLDDSAGLDPDDVEVTLDGLPATVIRTPDGALAAESPAVLADELRPGGTFAVPITITLSEDENVALGANGPGLTTLRKGGGGGNGDGGYDGDGSGGGNGGGDNGGGGGGGSLTVTAVLLATGFEPLQGTGVQDSASIDF